MFRVTVLIVISTAACALATSGCLAPPDGDADPGSAPGDHGGWIPPPPDEDDIGMDGLRIRNPATHRCLTVVPGELFVVATGCSVTNAFQRWDLIDGIDGATEILSVGMSDSLGEDACLTLGVDEPGAEPTMNPCEGDISQAWDIAPVPGRPDEITISNQGQFLEAGTGGPNVVVGPLAQKARQRWRLSP